MLMRDQEPHNYLLQRLPSSERARVLNMGKPVTLPKGTVLFQPHLPVKYAFFLTAGLSSTINLSEEGNSTEVGIVGKEGLVNGALLLGPARPPVESLVQVDGSALQISLRDLETIFRDSDVFRRQVLESLQAEAFASLTVAGCYRHHSLEQRLARWLLTVQDRVASDQFEMTQTFLALLLGSSRPSLALGLKALRDRHLIESQRERIRITDRAGLQDAACSCYETVRKLYAQATK